MITQKMKTLRTAAIWLVPSYVLLTIGGKFFAGAAIVGLIFGGFTLLKGMYQFVSASSDEVLAHKMTEGLPYRHFFQDSGIALDPKNQQLHLYSKPHYKTYKFEDIRRFETNIQTGGAVYGRGLAVVAGNLASAKNNAKSSGLFIDVRDIDFPRWKVDFNLRKIEKELPRWMEILRQHVNES